MADLFYRTVRAGEVVFSQGDAADCAYAVESGEVEVRVRRNDALHRIATVGVGELLGEMALLDATPRSADAIALSDTRLIVIEQNQISAHIQTADPVLRLVLEVMLGRLRRQIQQTHLSDEQSSPAAKTTTLSERGLSRIVLENELRAGLAAGEMEMNVQPIADMADGKIAGFESLIRWHHPVRGVIRADELIAVAEQSGLMVPVGRWIMHQSFQAAVLFESEDNSAGLKGKKSFMSVNISSVQIHDPEFMSVLGRELHDTGLDPRRLKFEITESVLADTQKAKRWIDDCKSLGIRIALDDFGTGYCSLAYLHDFDIDTLKIDQSFVRRMMSNERSEKIVAAIMKLAQTLGMNTIAEGIETCEQYDRLAHLGCQYAQGYLISRPMPVGSYFDALDFTEKFKMRVDA